MRFIDKISINVEIPALSSTYDFIVPSNMAIQDAQKLMIRILSSEYGISDNSKEVILIDKKDNSALRLECSFIQVGITDGAKLLLI